MSRDLSFCFREGDVTKLEAQAIVNSTNEALTDRNPISERIHEMAGPELAAECRQQLQGCRTGEAKISKGYRLPARYLFEPCTCASPWCQEIIQFENNDVSFFRMLL